MKEVTQTEFYSKLMAETKIDIITAITSGGQRGQFYPLIKLFHQRYNKSYVFGQTINLGYINGVPVSKYFLPN